MNAVVSEHARVRAQQRGVPPLIQSWLLDYGAAEFDGRGGVVRYFSHVSVRNLEHSLGRSAVRHMHEFLRCYLVEGSIDGTVITTGKRYKGRRIRRH